MADFINTVDIIGDDVLTASIIDRSIESYHDDTVTNIGAYAFCRCTNLTSIDLPLVTSVGSNGFDSCTNLTSIDLPLVTSVGQYAFKSCVKLTSVILPFVTNVDSFVFNQCAILASIDLPLVTSIKGSNVFNNCSKLNALILRKADAICTLSYSSSFTQTPIAKGTGYIYVPKALLSDDDETKDYRRATNWTTYANQFRALEDYTVDGTITGELDPTKI